MARPVLIALYLVLGAVSSETTSLFAIREGICTQTILDQQYVRIAEEKDPEVRPGNCEERGFTQSGGSHTFEIEDMGEVTLESFTNPNHEPMQARHVPELSAAPLSKVSVYAVVDSLCLEAQVDPVFLIAAPKELMPVATAGTCEEQGYSVPVDKQLDPGMYEFEGGSRFFTKPEPSATPGTTTLYAIMDGMCVQSTVDSTAVEALKALRPSINEGTCSNHGYTVSVEHEDIQDVPVIGSLTLDVYALPEVVESSATTATLYSIIDGTCIQGVIQTQYVDVVKSMGLHVNEGVCATQGYTVLEGHKDLKKIPELGGEVSVDFFSKEAMLEEEALLITDLYSIELGYCTQIGVGKLVAPILKRLADGMLTVGTCKSQGYTVNTGHTVISNIPGVGKAVVDVFTKSTADGGDGRMAPSSSVVPTYLRNYKE